MLSLQRVPVGDGCRSAAIDTPRLAAGVDRAALARPAAARTTSPEAPRRSTPTPACAFLPLAVAPVKRRTGWSPTTPPSLI
ncbi:MAG: hypothetical protein ABSG43_17780 [Solirubrobacteraceae bacterium]|jgi:hypothetical protein